VPEIQVAYRDRKTSFAADGWTIDERGRLSIFTREAQQVLTLAVFNEGMWDRVILIRGDRPDNVFKPVFNAASPGSLAAVNIFNATETPEIAIDREVGE
jgi:hypothetical protein